MRPSGIAKAPHGSFAVERVKYLAFERDGLVRRFPLREAMVTIGRGPENDIVIEDDLASRVHLQVQVDGGRVLVKDLLSRNGTRVDGTLVREAELALGASFSVAGVHFSLCEAPATEFEAVPVLRPAREPLAPGQATVPSARQTKDARDARCQVLRQLRHAIVCRVGLNEVFGLLSKLLPTVSGIGSVFVVGRGDGGLAYLSSCTGAGDDPGTQRARLEGLSPALDDPDALASVAAANGLAAIPLRLGRSPAALVRVPRLGLDGDGLAEFLEVLALEIELAADALPAAARAADASLDSLGSELIITRNAEMAGLCRQARRIARSDIPVLIQGESGTGKELFARLVHAASGRAERPFVAINCAAIPETLLESELFGCEKGAFTGADQAKRGRLELASKGTLVLDEIGDMPPPVQAKLLRALEEHRFFRLGGSSEVKVDLRVVSITNADLMALVREKRFRDDLYYRLAQHTLAVPPLRRHPEDIPVLTEHFLGLYCSAQDKYVGGLARPALQAMESYAWPGNVRQLRNEVHRLVTLADDGEVIGVDLLSAPIRSREPEPASPDGAPRGLDPTIEREGLIRRLERNGWNKARTARELGITWQGLWWKMRKLGITRETSC
jgi:DNA-binding NtrC family response regulator